MMSSEKSKLAFDQARWDFLVSYPLRLSAALPTPKRRACCPLPASICAPGSPASCSPLLVAWRPMCVFAHAPHITMQVRQRERVQKHLGMPHQILRSVATKL